jgi:hypothetical protein
VGAQTGLTRRDPEQSPRAGAEGAESKTAELRCRHD